MAAGPAVSLGLAGFFQGPQEQATGVGGKVREANVQPPTWKLLPRWPGTLLGGSEEGCPLPCPQPTFNPLTGWVRQPSFGCIAERRGQRPFLYK